MRSGRNLEERWEGRKLFELQLENHQIFIVLKASVCNVHLIGDFNKVHTVPEEEEKNEEEVW